MGAAFVSYNLQIQVFFQRHSTCGFGYNLAFFCLCFGSSLPLLPAYYMSFSFMIPSLFPFLPPLPLSLCLQPSRRPSLQPTFSLDCLSAPSPHHHCHPNQRFASQLSLCLGNPHPSSPCTSSHLPTPPLYSSSMQLPHHFSSSPNPPLAHLENNMYYNNTKLNPESKAHPSFFLQSNAHFCSPSHTSSDSQSNGSCPLKTNPPAKSNNPHPCHFSTLLSQSSPYLNTLPRSMLDICPHTLKNIQPESNSNLKTPLLPRFDPGCQTNPSIPLQPDSNPRHQVRALQSCGRPPLGSHAPLMLPHTERVLQVPSAYSLSSTNQPPSQLPSHPVTTYPPFPIPCFERPMSRPLKAGFKAVLITKTNLFVFMKKKKLQHSGL